MEFISVFFILLSIFVLVYLVYSFKAEKKLSKIWDILFFGIYGAVFIIFVYPPVLNVLENILGIQSAINFVVYLSIFVLFFLVYFMYHKVEAQRVEITKLVREIALLRKDDKKKK